MDKKTILALALCGAILALWMVLFPAPKPAAPPPGASCHDRSRWPFHRWRPVSAGRGGRGPGGECG